MTDPITIISGVSGVSVTIVRLIYTLSQFIDEVLQVPAEVQRLSNELAALYASLGQIKLAVEAPRRSPVPEDWTTQFESMLKDCEETLTLLEGIVNKAKSKESKRTATQVWKSVKFAFKEKQVEVIRKRLVSYNAVLTNMLLVLSDSRGAYAEQQLAEIRDIVEALRRSQENVKEVLVVLENENADDTRAEFVLSDRSQRSKSSRHDRPPAVYRPSAEEAAAKALAASKSWSLKSLSFRGSMDSLIDKDLKRDASMPELRVRIEQKAPLAILFYGGADEATCCYRSYLIYNDITHIPQSTTVIIATSRFQNQIKQCNLIPGRESLEFLSPTDAAEFFNCVERLEQLHRRCWEGYVIAMSPLMDNFKVDTQENIELSAVIAASTAASTAGPAEHSCRTCSSVWECCE